MLTSFNIDDNFRKLKWDTEDTKRLYNYNRYRELYRSEFTHPFRGVINKLLQRYPLQNTTAQTLIEVNLFKSLTDFFKFLTTNDYISVSLEDPACQTLWDKISEDNNFISVLKEVCIDNSRFGDALFKVAYQNNEVKIFSVCPDCWFPVFNNGNLNDLSGHILLFDIIRNGKIFKHIEKIHKGYIENEIWEVSNNVLARRVQNIEDFGLLPVDDFSDKWNDFVLFPVKNTTESDTFYGESDYKSCESIIEEIMLTVSQNSKIINRHANPKLAGSIENTELNPLTGERHFPNSDFITMGKDGQTPQYITADLQSEAIKSHIDTLMNFFYILTKTPPQAYGIDISSNMSGESLKTILSASIAKVNDIRTVSLTNSVKKVVKCALAFSGLVADNVDVNWEQKSEQAAPISDDNVIKLVEKDKEN